MAELRRSSRTPGRTLAADDRAELRRLLDAIPVGAMHKDEPVLAFVRTWYRLHVPANLAGYGIHYLRFTESAPADLLQRLRIALDDPDLRSVPRPNCDCPKCGELREDWGDDSERRAAAKRFQDERWRRLIEADERDRQTDPRRRAYWDERSEENTAGRREPDGGIGGRE